MIVFRWLEGTPAAEAQVFIQLHSCYYYMANYDTEEDLDGQLAVAIDRQIILTVDSCEVGTVEHGISAPHLRFLTDIGLSRLDSRPSFRLSFLRFWQSVYHRFLPNLYKSLLNSATQWLDVYYNCE